MVMAVQHWGPSALFISQYVLVILNFWGTFWTFWEKRLSCSDGSSCFSNNFCIMIFMKNQKQSNDDDLYCLLYDCVLYPLQQVKPCAWGNVSMACLVSGANWFSNLWIHIEWLVTGRRIINSENRYRGFTTYFDKKFGQKWLFRLFLHSTY